MAGGKETPRQKMIGMMYLVLLAMLAMNVSKQIINAFVTLDSKLGISEKAIVSKNTGLYDEFEGKFAGAQSKDEKALVTKWMDKAHDVKMMADRMSDFLVLEASAIIKEAEGVDWHIKDEESGRMMLKPLMDIEGKDKYDEPTRLMVGDDPGNPNERGVKLYESMHYYRDSICQIMATYKEGKKSYTFVPTFDGKSLVKFSPEGNVNDISELRGKLLSVNPDDTTNIINVYKLLSLPAVLPNHDETYTWQAAMFDHAPIVAAAAIFTSMKVDVRNAESEAVDYLLTKIDVPTFKFNKIDPLAFASSSYINQGDSLTLSVMIAAYDSTDTPKIRYGMDADTLPENWKELTGPIALSGATPGAHRVKGVIMVKKRGELVPKPWDFNYTVGAPMGVVAQPNMRVLYQGYDNIVEGTASGFPADMVSLSGSGCSLSSKGKGQYVARVGRGTRKASISVSGKKEDGSSVSLGKFDFDVRPMPPATAYFGKTTNGGKASYQAAKSGRLRVAYDPSVPLTGVTFSIKGGFVTVSGVPGKGKVLAGGTLDGKAKSLIKQAKGKTVSMIVDYKGPDGVGRKTAVIFDVR